MTCTHRYTIIQKSLTALENLSVLPVHLFPPQTLATTGISIISIVFLIQNHKYLESYTKYVAFSDWILLLSNMHLIPPLFAHFFSALHIPQFIHSSEGHRGCF